MNRFPARSQQWATESQLRGITLPSGEQINVSDWCFDRIGFTNGHVAFFELCENTKASPSGAEFVLTHIRVMGEPRGQLTLRIGGRTVMNSPARYWAEYTALAAPLLVRTGEHIQIELEDGVEAVFDVMIKRPVA